LVSLGSNYKKAVIDSENRLKMMHSFESMSFLKVEPINMTSFYCQDETNKIIAIEHEWK